MAVCQNKPGYDKTKNIKQALSMITEASDHQAQLVLLPEIFFYPYEIDALKNAAEENNETLEELKDSAKKHKIYLCTGSLAVKEGKFIYNRSYFISPEGEVLGHYDKCHLFDVDLPELKVQESATFTPGNKMTIIDTPLARFGFLICYDIRFPEMARLLSQQKVEVLLVPAAFNTKTGPAHWHIIFRTRAVENQFYLAVASPARNKKTKYHAYGHSMIIDPWGKVLAEAGKKEKIIYAEVRPEKLKETREILPLLKHRRDDMYELKYLCKDSKGLQPLVSK